MRTCTKCGVTKDLSEYYKTGRGDKRHGSCKECFKKKSKESSERLGKDHRKNINLQWWYNITLDDYNSLLNKQGGRCVCGATKGRKNAESLHVDHCHETGKVRGLLCHKCNRAIGLVEDPMTLRKLADYLEINQ